MRRRAARWAARLLRAAADRIDQPPAQVIEAVRLLRAEQTTSGLSFEFRAEDPPEDPP